MLVVIFFVEPEYEVIIFGISPAPGPETIRIFAPRYALSTLDIVPTVVPPKAKQDVLTPVATVATIEPTLTSVR